MSVSNCIQAFFAVINWFSFKNELCKSELTIHLHSCTDTKSPPLGIDQQPKQIYVYK